ncbi:unnamed protein product, partial [Didymodactylos carnosus]
MDFWGPTPQYSTHG